jgi:hypothetical protein
MGIMATVRLGRGSRPVVLSEITFPPFGYVMTLGSEAPDDRLFDITYFSRYAYNEFHILEMRPVVLDTPTYVPADYRTPEEVVRELARQDEEERRSGSVD